MNLTDTQKQKVAVWIEEGMSLADIQRQIVADFELNLTYMDTRFLVDDLKLTPKDAPEEPKPEPAPVQETEIAPAGEAALAPDEAAAPASGNLQLTVDMLAKPGTIVSGSVVFSDGKKAAWYLDQTGRLGVTAEEEGYRPSPADVQSFQLALDKELAGRGF